MPTKRRPLKRQRIAPPSRIAPGLLAKLLGEEVDPTNNAGVLDYYVQFASHEEAVAAFWDLLTPAQRERAMRNERSR